MCTQTNMHKLQLALCGGSGGGGGDGGGGGGGYGCIFTWW